MIKQSSKSRFSLIVSFYISILLILMLNNEYRYENVLKIKEIFQNFEEKKMYSNRYECFKFYRSKMKKNDKLLSFFKNLNNECFN